MMTEYEYRVLSRPEGSDAEWQLVITNRGAGRPYRTLSGAKTVASRERNKDERRLRYSYNPPRVHEYKIQRRPVTTDWEDVE